jgi:flagellar biosynthetic protein FliR
MENLNVLSLIPYIYEKFIVFILIFSRIASLLGTFILFRQDIVNRKVLTSLTGVLSLYVLLFYYHSNITYDFLSIQMVIHVVFQVFLGFVAGLILNIVFEVFSSVGQLISTQIGLGMASMFDPRMGSITTLTHFYTFSIALIFLLMNGHLFVIQTIIETFTTIPLTEQLLPTHLMKKIFDYSSVIFSGAVLLSITIITAILITNFALAILTKFAPQFNIFSIGINLSLIIGLICVYVTFNLFVGKAEEFLSQALEFFKISLIKLN